MRSGNGRHRRPRQAPALIVAAGVTGSAIAIPLLGAAGASAADASTWDRVAECESGGMWSANLGNGYYGGLQISQETWDDFGGAEYAASADLASRSQQIAIAEKILDAQGPQAWASCAAVSGLTVGSAAPSVDPGTTPGATPETAPGSSGAAKPSETSGKTGKTGSAAPSDASSDTSAPDATTPDGTKEPAPAESAGSAADAAKGKHRGDAAPNDSAPGNSGEERESGRHASRGDGSTRNADGVTDRTEGSGAVDGEYTVRVGDCLWLIADEREVPGGWTALYEANKGTVGADPDLILPGQTLDLGVK
ncbi:transglycosylase family protein [Streptomyces scopuliridis]|uniref:transglycosylase family protein n=1 Tax=Streptomyces scopuliridis TaxID=452529 RepID=UPI002DD9D48A|nr:transglycosylase family protein [Streptomyces scopuliridis]